MSFFHGAYGQYLPIGILPMEYNPSFAGSVGNSRIVSNFSFSNGASYYDPGVGMSLSYDNYYPTIRSGIGIIAKSYCFKIDDKFRDLDTSIELVVAPKISIKGKFTLSPSVSIKYDKFYNYYNDSWHNWDNVSSKFGLLFNAPHYYIGYAAEYSYGHSGLKTALQFGYTFQRRADSKFSFTPQLALPIFIDSGLGIFYPSYNLSFRYGSMTLGAISQFEYPYPTGFQVGWQNRSWRILLSNNFKDRYTGNFTLRYIFNHDKKSMNILY